MHDQLFYKYYDLIYSVKDYQGEVKSILDVYHSIVGGQPRRIIDVGCGTGSHSFHFAKAGCSVVGTDIDAEEIAIASKKVASLPEPRPQFHCVDIARLDDEGFDLGVSLFNVVSYIHGIANLTAFVTAIRKRLHSGGVFVFDCWNGAAAMSDPPQLKKNTITLPEKSFEVETIPALDLMKQTVNMRNVVSVTGGSMSPERFEYAYSQFLWTPAVLSEILASAGFRVNWISPAIKPTQRATGTTWKIMFACIAI